MKLTKWDPFREIDDMLPREMVELTAFEPAFIG